jgi:hypothetical protein
MGYETILKAEMVIAYQDQLPRSSIELKPSEIPSEMTVDILPNL